MSVGDPNSIQGRCPTCGQVVILSMAARAQLVECPRCGHQGTGALFVGIEAPLPVLLVQRPDPLTDVAVANIAFADIAFADIAVAEVACSAAAFPAAAFPAAAFPAAAFPDEGQDGEQEEEAVSDAYDAALSRVRGPRASPEALVRDERTLLMGDARTLLRLDSPPLKTNGGRVSRAASARTTERPSLATKRRAGEEERTHLLLDPFDLKDERDTALTRLTATLRPFAQRTLRLGLRLDELLHGRWSVAFAVLGIACGVLPPLFDYLTDDPASTASVIASIGAFIGLSAFGLAWLGSLRQDDGGWDWKVVGVRLSTLTRLLQQDIQEFGRSPRYLQLRLGAELLAGLGLGGSSLAACLGLIRLFMGASDPPSLLRFLSGLSLVAGVVLLGFARRAAPASAPGPTELSESLHAAGKLPPLVDLCEPLPTSLVGEDTLLHRVLFALSEWRSGEWLDEAGYRVALERHLQRHLPGYASQRERWLGGSRLAGVADVIVGDLVLIEVKHGFRQRSAERAFSRLRGHGRLWPGKPMILAIFAASREVVFDGDATAALVELHQTLPMLTVRMPSRRQLH
jgi:hypothetical protein